MYRTLAWDCFAEIPLHLALVLCGACGYMFMMLANRFQSSLRVWSKTVSTEVDKPLKSIAAPEKLSQPRSGKRSRTNRCAKKQAAVSGQCEDASLEQKRCEDASNEDGPTPLVESPMTEVMQEPDPSPVSDRVVRLLAKKAERKARKANERVQQQELEQAQETATFNLLDENSSGLLEGDPSKIARVPVAEKAMLSVVPESSVSQDDCLLSNPSSLTDGQRMYHEAEMGVSNSELSTGDEALMSSFHLEETGEESTDASESCVSEDCLEEHWDNPSFGDKDSLQNSNRCPDQVSSLWLATEQNDLVGPRCLGSEGMLGQFQGESFDDAWMAPFEEIIRSREEAERVYEQVYNSCTGVHVLHQSQYQPVLCDGNQQLYTDGEQFFMLASVDAPTDSNISGPRLMRPVVDPRDPLHAEFAREIQTGLVQLPPAEEQSMVCILPPNQGECDPRALIEEGNWDVCWGLAM